MNRIRILCVDDERNVLRALERIFMDYDYEILTASSGEEALQLLAEAPVVRVVISDYRMPGMNGVDFLKEVCAQRPETIRIVLSGYADTAAVVAAINEGKIYKFIPKPWNDDELRLTVEKALETFDIHRHNQELAEELTRKDEELARLKGGAGRSAQALDDLPVGILSVDREGCVREINRAAAAMLGVTREEAATCRLATHFPFLQPPGGATDHWRTAVGTNELLVGQSETLRDGEPMVLIAMMWADEGREGSKSA
ncbi:response regulator [Geomonas sp. Red32]|uniref:response regulator n=1 Tax=Geomonas sp. Red32 TaxID=2912856 RepID=UPI00202CAF34|nr:response regulator [Geomonas sp. Red32]MCM0080401.1 response regulator [Geomonas sp. Red32]